METNFIKGITVLATETTKGTDYVPLSIIIIEAAFLFLVSGVFCTMLFQIKNNKEKIAWIAFCAILSISLGVVLFFYCGDGSENLKEITYYKVAIDDSVGWNDVNKLYNIENVDGDIITLTIKSETEE